LERKVLIVAGPNGAGKTTFAREVLAFDRGLALVNPDEIAARLNPASAMPWDLHAARHLLGVLDRLALHRRSFLLETTLAGRAYVRRIHAWRAAGYRVGLIFLGLSSPDLAVERVRVRVRQGGHDVPEADIRRRFFAGFSNFRTLYAPIVDRWQFLDCSTGLRILRDESPRS
jgi:predicted ABC-type ATPase